MRSPPLPDAEQDVTFFSISATRSRGLKGLKATSRTEIAPSHAPLRSRERDSRKGKSAYFLKGRVSLLGAKLFSRSPSFFPRVGMVLSWKKRRCSLYLFPPLPPSLGRSASKRLPAESIPFCLFLGNLFITRRPTAAPNLFPASPPVP